MNNALDTLILTVSIKEKKQNKTKKNKQKKQKKDQEIIHFPNYEKKKQYNQNYVKSEAV